MSVCLTRSVELRSAMPLLAWTLSDLLRGLSYRQQRSVLFIAVTQITSKRRHASCTSERMHCFNRSAVSLTHRDGRTHPSFEEVELAKCTAVRWRLACCSCNSGWGWHRLWTLGRWNNWWRSALLRTWAIVSIVARLTALTSITLTSEKQASS